MCELAWTGGFITGEGSFSVWNIKGKKTLMLSIGQVERAPLERVKAALGMGGVYGPVGPYPPAKHPRHDYRLQGFERVQAVIAMLWPWLSPAKKEQARVALQSFC